MGKAKMMGQFKPCLPNSRADMRRPKHHIRNREFTNRHEAALQESREKRFSREQEAWKRGVSYE